MAICSGDILGLHVGKATIFGPKDELSAIRKSRVDQATLGSLGLDGDEQADLTAHGGTDKAVNLYPTEHYPWWKNTLSSEAGRLSIMAAFGENITTQGLIETDVCVGDRFEIGEAVLEISQGRQPCWKLNHLFGDPSIVKQMTQSARCGFYARVIQGGLVRETDGITLLDRPNPHWTVDRCFRLLFHKGPDADALKSLVELEPLASSWREKAMARILEMETNQ